MGVNSGGKGRGPSATYWTTTYPWYLLFTFNVALEIASPASFVATHCTVPLSPDCRLVNLSSFLLFIWIRPTFDGATFCPLWNQVIWGFGEPVALHLNTTDSWGYLSAKAGWTVKVGFSKEQGNYIDTVKSKTVTLIAKHCNTCMYSIFKDNAEQSCTYGRKCLRHVQQEFHPFITKDLPVV